MRVLIGCEVSGRVRDAFLAKGHDAWSNDLLPTQNPGPHLQGDVFGFLEMNWDLAIFFPPCTYLCASGLHRNGNNPERREKTKEAIEFVKKLLAAPIEKIALENPIGCLSTKVRKPDQIVQPWWFGHDESKATCLWLKNLSRLAETHNVRRPAWIECPNGCDDFFCQRHLMHTADCDCLPIDDWVIKGDDPYRERYANQTPSGQNKLGPSKSRAMIRSITYLGLAKAMAEFWG